MCRTITFSGTCSHCGGVFTWDDLVQQLSCLEAKNVGVFGQCRRGVAEEKHTFDQECERCSAELEADEGYGGMEDDVHAAVTYKAKGKNKMADGVEDGRRQSKRQRTT
ncbi:hypothetical protein OQA88_8939 [Cercophora sp. LCS_1]